MKTLSGVELMQQIGKAVRGWRVEITTERALACHTRIARILRGWRVQPAGFHGNVWHFEGGGTLSVKGEARARC